METNKCWVVYILRCKDNTLYTGITDDLNKRLKAHNEGKGAKYTRGRGPVQLYYWEYCPDKSAFFDFLLSLRVIIAHSIFLDELS